MQLSELLQKFAAHPQVAALAHILSTPSTTLTHLQGLQASAAPTIFSALTVRKNPTQRPFLFVLNDEEEAGYFYHDLTQMPVSYTHLTLPTN